MVNKDNFLKSSKIQRVQTFLVMLVKADQRYILKSHFITSSKNTLILKDPPCNQIISKIILKLSRLCAKEAQLFCIDNWNCFNIFLYFIKRSVNKRILVSLFFPWSGNFFLSCEFSLELSLEFLLSWEFYTRVENFPMELRILLKSWEFSHEVENFAQKLETFSLELRIFSLTWEFFSLKRAKS